jgi:hypothetical protein
MATKSKKSTRKAAPKKSSAPRVKSVSECSPRECIRENKMLKMHVTVITVLSIVVGILVLALIMAIKDN